MILKPSMQFLFIEAVASKPRDGKDVDSQHDVAMDSILQELSSLKITMKKVAYNTSKTLLYVQSILHDLASFSACLTGAGSPLDRIDSQLSSAIDWEQDHNYLQKTTVDLENWNHHNNLCFSGVPEILEGTDMLGFLHDFLLSLTQLSFEPLLEFKWGIVLIPGSLKSSLDPPNHYLLSETLAGPGGVLHGPALGPTPS
ncbi:hypothetical protein NDU88_004701 [Pleurodeles waltl]|uniref:Leptin n=1 Tax=Pleurodeles waltl TaxID=8319 RepID=A0AAV7RJY0_PLEWA|nr:hypothetical protein NDU88_004701 [Pleurodeles waltl]